VVRENGIGGSLCAAPLMLIEIVEAAYSWTLNHCAFAYVSLMRRPNFALAVFVRPTKFGGGKNYLNCSAKKLSIIVATGRPNCEGNRNIISRSQDTGRRTDRVYSPSGDSNSAGITLRRSVKFTVSQWGRRPTKRDAVAVGHRRQSVHNI